MLFIWIEGFEGWRCYIVKGGRGFGYGEGYPGVIKVCCFGLVGCGGGIGCG